MRLCGHKQPPTAKLDPIKSKYKGEKSMIQHKKCKHLQQQAMTESKSKEKDSVYIKANQKD